MSSIAQERLDAWTNDCPIENAMGRFTCIGCGRLVRRENGCADDLPNHCDDCWCKAHGADKVTEEDGRALCERLGIDVEAWAEEIRARIDVAAKTLESDAPSDKRGEAP